MSCNFTPLDSFVTTLSESLCASDEFLYLADHERLLKLLPDSGMWTTLAIYDNQVIEVVKAYNYCGVLVFDRGFELTKPLRFPCGSVVKFIMTKAGVEAMVCCDKWFEDCENG